MKKQQIRFFTLSILNAYSCLFYSYNIWFGAILLLISLLHFSSGFLGFLALLTAMSCAYMLGYRKDSIQDATLTYNSLMVGLGLGFFYAISWEMIVVTMMISCLTFLFTLFVSSFTQKYNLPFLSIPFLITFWIIVPALESMKALQFSTYEIYYLNSLYKIGGNDLVNFYQYLNNDFFPPFISSFFKTLSVIFFQNNIFTGILIAFGLIIHSRLAFLYGVWGYAIAFAFYNFVGIDPHQLLAFHAGFNFIIIASAIGTYYTIPSWYSLLTATLAVCSTILLGQGLQHIFVAFNSSAFSLPFVLTTYLFLWALAHRPLNKKPQVTLVQYFSPEKNFYRQSNNNERLKYRWHIPFSLPFFGEWIVSQGYKGKHTHIGNWANALDFIVVDDEMKQHAGEGNQKEDYYAFNKPIIANADGWIVFVSNITEDNEVGEVNTNENWGNSIIIKHAEGLYSHLGHLKKDSIKVFIGDFVRKGDFLANCGSSGRSPVAHLHFQFQTTPYLGAFTLPYPLGYYLTETKGKKILHSFEVPNESEIIQNVEINSVLKEIFYIYPNKKLKFEVKYPHKTQIQEWECFTNSYNYSYLYCHTTKSYAYFVNDGTMFYFTHFEGNKKSLLFYFYLGCYKVLQGFYEDIQIKDKLPLDLFINPYNMISDIFSPFIPIMKAEYCLTYKNIDNLNYTKNITLQSNIKIKLLNQNITNYQIETKIENKQLHSFLIQKGKKNIKATCILS